MKTIKILGQTYELDYADWVEHSPEYACQVSHNPQIIEIDNALSRDTKRLLLLRAIIEVICTIQGLNLSDSEIKALAVGLDLTDNIALVCTEAEDKQ